MTSPNQIEVHTPTQLDSSHPDGYAIVCFQSPFHSGVGDGAAKVHELPFVHLPLNVAHTNCNLKFGYKAMLPRY
jgi:hypothetical protein